jgi:hypothetical protein
LLAVFSFCICWSLFQKKIICYLTHCCHDSFSLSILWFGAGRGKKSKSNARLKSMEKKSSQTVTVAIKQKTTQERRWPMIRKEAKGSQCAGKRGAERATSNAQ